MYIRDHNIEFNKSIMSDIPSGVSPVEDVASLTLDEILFLKPEDLAERLTEEQLRIAEKQLGAAADIARKTRIDQVATIRRQYRRALGEGDLSNVLGFAAQLLAQPRLSSRESSDVSMQVYITKYALSGEIPSDLKEQTYLKIIDELYKEAEESREYGKVNDWCSIAIRVFPKNSLLLGRLAYLHMEKGDKETATEYFQKAVDHARNEEEKLTAYLRLGLFLLESGDIQIGADALVEALRVGTPSKFLFDSLILAINHYDFDISGFEQFAREFNFQGGTVRFDKRKLVFTGIQTG